MEEDRIRTNTDSDISDICLSVSFLFPSPRIETDPVYMYMHGNRFKYLGYIFFLFSYSIPSTPMLGAGLDRPCIEIEPHVFPCRARSGRVWEEPSQSARSRCPIRVHGRRGAGGSEPRAPACAWLAVDLVPCWPRACGARETGQGQCGVW